MEEVLSELIRGEQLLKPDSQLGTWSQEATSSTLAATRKALEEATGAMCGAAEKSLLDTDEKAKMMSSGLEDGSCWDQGLAQGTSWDAAGCLREESRGDLADAAAREDPGDVCR